MTEIARTRALAGLRRAARRARSRLAELAARLRRGERFSGDALDHTRLLRACGRRRLGRTSIVLACLACLALAAWGAAWWRLASGPVSLDIVTPWLISALEERFGGGRRIEVGGTVLERDEAGRTALRLRDIVVRDSAGAIVASAPKAEVGIVGSSWLTGHLRAERLSLIGAEMAVRIERDGQLSVFAAGNHHERPLATVATAAAAAAADGAAPSAAGASDIRADQPHLFETAINWLQTLDAVGLDGRDLIEIGLKSGNLAIDDRRSGKQVRFDNINLSLSKIEGGGAALAISSVGADGPWSLDATVTPTGDGHRAVEAVLRDMSPKDIMLALRLDRSDLQADMPLSAVIRAKIDATGMPQALHGRILAGAGYIGDSSDAEARILIDELQAEVRWDANHGLLHAPIEINAGPNRITLLGQIEPPKVSGGPWSFAIVQGRLLLASGERAQETPLMLDRVSLRAVLDPARRRVDIEQADLRGIGVGVAASGTFDYAGAEPRLMLGIACTRMGVPAFKRLWPAFIAPALRSWVERNVLAGAIDKVMIAVNAEVPQMLPSGPPMPPDGLSIELTGKGAWVRPTQGLPPIRDADVVARVSGGAATVTFGRATIELPSGRKLAVAGGSFDVASLSARPAIGRTKFHVEGPLEAAAELLAMEPLRDAAAVPFDAANSRGALAAQIALSLPLHKNLQRNEVTYAVEAELAGFNAERFLRGQKAEASLLRLNATHEVLQIKGDMRIGGAPAAVDYRKARGASHAEVRLQGVLDEAARTRLGIDFGNALSGPVPVRLHGRTKLAAGDNRFTIEADLSAARVTELVPGWSKPPGRSARASFVLIEKGESIRLEDFILEGSGAVAKGTLELDAQGELLSANLPVFALSDGDKASLKAERGGDGVLKLTLRGDVYDGRGLVKSTVSGHKPDSRARRASDFDLDMKVGAMTGHHGEALRGLELRLSRRGGQIRHFVLSGRLGRNARITGDLRGRGAGAGAGAGAGRQVMYLETNDAGALFRFTDIYPRILGGTLSMAMDPPTLDTSPREGLLNIRDFTVRGEPVLERVASSGSDSHDASGSRSAPAGIGVTFSRLRAEFTRSPGKFAIREGVVWGAAIGATVEGTLDYHRNEVRLRGTFIPAYALNNMFSRVPVLGLFLGGGDNEGLLGITYRVAGSPAAPVLEVNPMSAVAPGFLRKLFEFRGAEDVTSRVPEQVR